MKKMLIILITGFCWICFQKTDTTTKSSIITDEISQTYSNSLDKLLKCCDYTYDEGYFYYPDAGCVYDGTNNKLGNASVFLLQKKNKKIKNLSIKDADRAIEKVNNLTISEIKQEFIILVFLIEKKYLIKTSEGYYQKLPYVEKYFIYDTKSERWKLQSNFLVKNAKEDQYYANKVWQIVKTEIVSVDKHPGTRIYNPR